MDDIEKTWEVPLYDGTTLVFNRNDIKGTSWAEKNKVREPGLYTIYGTCSGSYAFYDGKDWYCDISDKYKDMGLPVYHYGGIEILLG